MTQKNPKYLIVVRVAKDKVDNLIRESGLTPNATRRKLVRENIQLNLSASVDSWLCDKPKWLIEGLE